MAALATGAMIGQAVGAATPTGARIGASGFATIRVAPPSPTGDVVSRRPNYNGPIEFYAQEEGLTITEARKRISEQMGFAPIFERLQERLRRLEPDNYISARIDHKPDWHYTLFFKRDPEATLRRYSVNPRFTAAKGEYSRAIVQRGDLPPRALAVPRVDPRIAPLLRGFASESLATTMQMEAGFSGRVVLDDGCLRLAGKGKAKGPLVMFHRETGIGLDAQGYLATIDRRSGKATGRIGELWSWAGPNPGTAIDGLGELRAACGAGPVVNVGNPQSEARFEARYKRN